MSSNDKKIEFKFVINGDEWVTSDLYWTVVDETGNVNNYIEFNESGPIMKNEYKNIGKTELGKTEAGKTEVGKTEVGKTIIPESGLSMPVIANEKENLNTTVLPSQEGIQTTLGEPGVVVPENPQEISAFKEVRNVDAKELNAEIKKEEALKEASESKPDELKTTVLPSQEGVQTTLGEPGIVVPGNPHEISAFSEVRDVDAKKLNEDIKKEDAAKIEEETAKPKYVKKVKKLVPADEVKEETKDSKDVKNAPSSANSAESKKQASPSKKEKRGLFSKLKKKFS